MAKVPQELKESDIPWEVVFTDTTKHVQIGLEQRQQALGAILVHVPPGVLFLGVIDVLVHVALHRPIATG